jgi:ATP-binding cassette, subfamily B, multidrug efflux pump
MQRRTSAMARNKYDVDEELVSSFNLKHLFRLLRYMKPYIRKAIFSVFLMIVASLCALLSPKMAQIAIDDMIPHKNITGLLLIALILVIALLINAICLKIRIKTMQLIGQKVIFNLRNDLFVHIQQLPFSFFDSRPHGKILVRVVNYINSLSDLLSNGIVNLITDIFTLFAIIVFMFFIDVRLTLICLAGLPVLIFATLLLKSAQRRGWQSISRKQSNLNAYIHESLCGMKVTQSFAREEENHKIFRSLGQELFDSWMKTMRIQSLLWPIIDNVSIISIIAVFAVGNMLMNSGITVGIMVAFSMFIWRFWEPITNIGNFYNSIVNAMAYMERVFEMMDEDVAVKNVPGAIEMSTISGDVRFENVNFSYEIGTKILDNVSFSVNAGETIALVGPTGAGKTTIVNLLSRFYNLDSGKIIIDDIDINNVTLESLRRQMGVMMQDTFIFSGTIMDNIRYSKLDATDEEVIKAAKIVRAHDFISEMSDGYQTEVNERGSRLSTGQRQLISFARALLADPKILILDEATSSIDTKTELLLKEGLDQLLKGRTSFIIAHRLSTIRNADCIMYIDDGKIVEKGTHEELMICKGSYWKLYTAQYSFLEAV